MSQALYRTVRKADLWAESGRSSLDDSCSDCASRLPWCRVPLQMVHGIMVHLWCCITTAITPLGGAIRSRYLWLLFAPSKGQTGATAVAPLSSFLNFPASFPPTDFVRVERTCLHLTYYNKIWWTTNIFLFLLYAILLPGESQGGSQTKATHRHKWFIIQGIVHNGNRLI